MNLLGIVNRGSPRLALNTLARELIWLCLSHKLVLSIEWVLRKSNTFAYDISKWLIPDDSISRHYFAMLDDKWDPKLATPSLPMRIITAQSSIPSIGAE